ncbi:MAG: ABC transporter ATP-binding protein [Candidatus Omnitrophota bacterium]|nr:ABC transporter ATP-binding protein [Candidatus Omnitrophota bacterium]
MKILQVDDLRTYFFTSHGAVKAVDGVNFDIEKREVFGLVGESGSGKTLTALSILRLIPESARLESGKVLFNGEDMITADNDRLRSIRGAKISIVFQEPSTALNPVFTIGYQMTEAVLAHRPIGKKKARDIAINYLGKVHIPQPEKVFGDYPHQISGGAKQRVMIAMALMNSPELVILDEPTTALDVTIQAGILDLLDEILEKEKVSMLFISHDFGIISRMCDRVAVMRKGRIVEEGQTDRIINSPREPYTMSLLESVKALL